MANLAILAVSGSLLGALELVPGAVEPAGEALHIDRGPGRQDCSQGVRYGDVLC